MIHYMNHNGRSLLEISGGIDDIIADTAYMILITYNELLKKNGCAAELYRDYFENYSKKIFEIDNVNNVDSKNIDSREKALDELLNALENVMKNRKKGGDDNA